MTLDLALINKLIDLAYAAQIRPSNGYYYAYLLPWSQAKIKRLVRRIRDRRRRPCWVCGRYRR